MAQGWRGLGIVVLVGLSGCASFSDKITGTARAGSEQLMLTETSDQAVACLDFRPLAGARVYFNDTQIANPDLIAGPDAGWVAFSLRRAMARQGVLLVDDPQDAQVLMEAALGAYGTDEVGCRLAMPSVGSLGGLPLPTVSSNPQGISRKVRQDAVVKLALLALDAQSHRLIWESGTILLASALDRRFVGTAEVKRSSTLPALAGYPRRH